jgi:hypothetical protein
MKIALHYMMIYNGVENDSDQQCVIIELRNQGIFQEMKLDKLIP